MSTGSFVRTTAPSATDHALLFLVTIPVQCLPGGTTPNQVRSVFYSQVVVRGFLSYPHPIVVGMDLIRIFSKFPDHEACLEHLERVRWGDSPECPGTNRS